MTRGMGWLLALALLGAQAGCDTNRTDTDGDGIHDGADCDPHSRYVWKQVQGYEDTDGDKVGAGESRLFCIGKEPPAGVSLKGGDCAPQDARRWLDLTGKGYYADADNDGVTSSTPATACVGADVSAYSRAPGKDCDDTNARLWEKRSLYADADGDTIGAGELIPGCIGDPNALPPGLSATNTDCAPHDSTRYRPWNYQGRDEDGDGYYVAVPGFLCLGATTPVGYTDQVVGVLDCDDTRADMWKLLGQYADTDGDGVGHGAEQFLCSAGTSPRPGYSLSSRDCAPEDATRWMSHTYRWRDADGDGATVAEVGQICGGYSPPAGYSATPGALTDCDDTRAEVSVTWNVFVDGDGDGVGAGSRLTLCAGPSRPAGHVDTGTDCAPEDASRWRLNSSPYRDADGDGFTVAAEASVCLGASSEGYPATSPGPDCDDTRAEVFQSLQVYVDTDGDGVGAGAALAACTAGSPPAGHSLQGTDCAPEDAARWRLHTVSHVDADRDGYTQPTTGQVCAAQTLPPPYTPSATGNDCDDTDATRFVWRVLYPDRDGDGVGAPPRAVLCLSATGVPPGYSIYGYDPDDTNPARSEPPDDSELEEALLSP